LRVNQDHRSVSPMLQRFDPPPPIRKGGELGRRWAFVLNSNFVRLNHRPGADAGRRDGQDQPGDPVRPRRHLNSIEWMAPAWADGSGTEVSWSQNATRQLAIDRLVDYRQTLDKKRAPRLRSHCSYNGLAGTRRGWDGSGP
jgi:hypothetical protein